MSRVPPTPVVAYRVCRSTCGSLWLSSRRSVTSFASRFFRACSTSVLLASARCVAVDRSIGSGRKSGRSTGSIVDVHSGSDVPLTMSRFSAISAVRRVPSAVTSACRCCAACDCACTTSMGAMVPISTFV